jgi:hypothetical protein
MKGSVQVVIWILLSYLGPFAPGFGFGEEIREQEQAKIQYLIKTVEALEGARFIRNGKAYDAKTAAEHLRRKWKAAGPRVKTAEDFIRYCASYSSVSGQAYRLRLPDGETVEAASFFRRKLAEFSSVGSPEQ